MLSLAHELPTTIDAEIGEVAMKKLLACARRMIVVSEFARQAISRRYGSPGDRMTALPVGWPATPLAGEADRRAARDAVRQRWGVPDDGFLVLGCGAIHPRKGPDLFVQVARDALARSGGERLHFLWVGGPQNSTTLLDWCLHDLAACGLSERVGFVGHVVDAAPYFDAADAFLLPSREDPFPLVNLEAMVRGLPIVAFDGAGGAPEALADGAGVVVPYLDTSEMARALVRVLEAPRYRDELSRHAVARHRERYAWDRFTSQLFELLHAEFALPLPVEVEEPALATHP